MLFFGRVISQEKQVRLTEVNFEVETVGNNAKVKSIHSILNDSNDDCNVSITMTLDDESAVTGYSFKTANGDFESELKEKEQAKIEQSDATTNGYSSAVMEQVDDTTFSITLGLINKHSEVTFSIEYLTHMEIQDDELVMKIPNLIESDEKQQIPYSIKVTGSSTFSFKGVLSGEEEVNIPLNGDLILGMKDEDTDEVVISSTFINKEKEGNINIVFICDRSGSMYGEGIKALRNMLQLFLRQLPLNSKFQIISFGSTYDFIFKEITEYNEDTLKFASETVSHFEANYGGTNMHAPLKALIDNNTEKCHIILLTDGYVDNKTSTIEYIRTLSKKNSLHGVGLGRSCDVELIRNIGRIGNGISAISKNPNVLKKEVSKITERILIPSINECTVEWNIKGEITPKEISNFYGMTTCYIQCNEEIKEGQNIESEIKGRCGEKEVTYKNTKSINITKGIIVHQLMALNQIRKLESENKKEEAKKLSMKYHVLCKETAFIAVDKTTKKEVDFIKNIKLSEISHTSNVFYNSLTPPHTIAAAVTGSIAVGGGAVGCACLPPPPPCYAYPPPPPLVGCACPPPPPGNSSIVMGQEENLQQQESAKESLFEKIVKCQKATGEFVGVDTFIKEIGKFKNIQFDQTIVQTFFVVQLLHEKFIENKIEWKLLVKKAEKWLATKLPLPEEIKAQIISLAKSIILK
ncbi:Vault protein inter-alpha-trypsin domain/von Willebrand factor type A domain containing protein, putative [Entamoeba histolytica]